MRYQKEHAVIERVATQLIALVNDQLTDRIATKDKTSKRDLVSAVDLAADALIVSALQKHFPDDALLTEESHPHTPLTNRRAWIIDPICGSTNLAHGIRFFVTNIALVLGEQPVAAWIVDHSRQRVVWSVGGALWDGKRKIPRLRSTTVFPVVDTDWGYFYGMSQDVRRRYATLVGSIRMHGSLETVAFGSSLSFAYVATGQLQGSVTINIHPWDFVAPIFLIEQNGGVVTNFDGSPWGIRSKSLVMAGDKGVHRKLLRFVKAQGLQNVK